VQGEEEGTREERKERGRERDGGGGPYPLIQTIGGGVHHGGRSGDGELSTEQLHCSQEEDNAILQKIP
jgi:hypothetical protein